MLVTANWINDYLKKIVSADEQAEMLTAAGFPLEGRDDLPDGDIRQDFEMTSNRGDCTCHIGLAREIAARSGNTLVLPECKVMESGPSIEESISVSNLEPELCPLYTVKVILGAHVEQSPKWLRTKIENRGDIPRNAIVDATNFVLFEQGQPTHVFDLDKLAGNQIVIRRAKEGETFLPLGEDAVELKLTSDDLVIADAEKPVALAGVKGGAHASVTDETTNLLIETATFNPVIVREMSRRHKISSDSSFRFERGVHARQIAESANRLASILLDVGGGVLCKGTLSEGKDLPSPISVSMRTDYCNERLGSDLSSEQMATYLNAVGFETETANGVIESKVPYYRGDIYREIDLVEEVGRIHGYEHICIEDSIHVQVPTSGGESEARQSILNALAGMGFVECVTHSLVSEQAALCFLAPEQSALTLDDDRTSAESALRPSIIPSLLTVRKHNEDNGVKNVRLAELGSIFVLENGTHIEQTELGLLVDCCVDGGIEELRGVTDRICALLTTKNHLSISPANDIPWLDACGVLSIEGRDVGYIGRLEERVQQLWGLGGTFCIVQLRLGALFAGYPPEQQAHPLPSQPAIERDLSLIVQEDVLWSDIVGAIEPLQLDHLEKIEYITTYRGTNIDEGKKSLTLRLRFRDVTRTLTHDEVNAPVAAAVESLASNCGAEIRS